jgi:alginate O-acetyltransferase complex protein AlgI
VQFNSLEYAVLLTAVFALYWCLVRLRALRLLLLLGASYLFYAWWNPYYLGLVLFSSTTDYLIGRRLHASAAHKRAWLALSCGLNLGLLGTFKYFDFFMSTLQTAAGKLHLSFVAPHLEVVVPIGISFYTFESLSYVIDIYRGRLEPADSPLDFFAFISFFPHLVAGPIMRAYQFLPQLTQLPALTLEKGGRGLYLICVGLLKKSLIADLLAVNLVDRVFETPARYTSVELLAGVYGYALQIYCDFSAYSDLAIGSALLLGLELPRNFELPYRAVSIPEFWRRWHITLSTWLRDYLYMSLGGGGRSRFCAYRNLFLTMLLGGLWHGAAWTFVAWGALHGLGLAVSRAWAEARVGAGPRPPAGPLRKITLGLLTFHFVCLGWVFFRAPSFGRGAEVLTGIAAWSGGAANLSPLLWGLLAAGFATHLLPLRLSALAEKWMIGLPGVLQAAVLVGVVIAIRLAGTSAVVPFIYFQF